MFRIVQPIGSLAAFLVVLSWRVPSRALSRGCRQLLYIFMPGMESWAIP